MTSQRKQTGVQIVAAGAGYPAQFHEEPKKTNRLEFFPRVWNAQLQRNSMASQRKRTGVQIEAAGVDYAATAHFHDKPEKTNRRSN